MYNFFFYVKTILLQILKYTLVIYVNDLREKNVFGVLNYFLIVIYKFNFQCDVFLTRNLPTDVCSYLDSHIYVNAYKPRIENQ